MTGRAAPDAVGDAAHLRPVSITVLYDANCVVCRRSRRWVEHQRQLVPVEFVAAGSPRARERFPDLDVAGTLTDVTVITDRGAVLRGDAAWITVLWAVARTRPTAVKLAHGRGRRTFRGVKGATETIRRLSAASPDPRLVGDEPDGWPPPSVASAHDAKCERCRT